MRSWAEYKVLREHKWKDYTVSTYVWLGTLKSLKFETMAFDDFFTELETDRYATEEEARRGHVKMLYRWILK